MNHEPRIRIRLTSTQHDTLRQFLLPGDGLEAVAIVVCGRAGGCTDEVLVAHQVIEVPYEACRVRTADRVTWPTDVLIPILPSVAEQGFALLKIHSHPGGFPAFSHWDDESDRELFPGVYAWADSDRPHMSAIMLPDGSIKARIVNSDATFGAEAIVTVIGESIRQISVHQLGTGSSQISVRTAQAFGEATVAHLRQLTVGVVGCSGTGSWIVEMLGRLGVGALVLIDPDEVEMLNLNRIVHASIADAQNRRPKVHVLADAIRRTGLAITVECIVEDVHRTDVVRRLSRCDVIFGCVDTVDARDLMSRISTYYVLPYIDVGVRLVADGTGGIAHIVGSANYVYPDSPSLMERGLYTPKQLSDAGLRRTDAAAYAKQLDAGYIAGVSVARPAVASVNAFYASLAVNELLERIHGYREESNALGVTISLSQLRVLEPSVTASTPSLNKKIGRGDTRPLLGMPSLTESV